MRRPLKPFVTEYKATNRRPKDGAGLFGVEPEASMPEAPTRKPPRGAELTSTKPAQPHRRGDAQRGSEALRYNGGPLRRQLRGGDARCRRVVFGGTFQPSACQPDARQRQRT